MSVLTSSDVSDLCLVADWPGDVLVVTAGW